MLKKTSASSWDRARRRSVKRFDMVLGKDVQLEPGVKYFVLQLERMGCITLFSCEGHPSGFYIAFNGPYEVAVKLASFGFLTIEISHGAGDFHLGLGNNEVFQKFHGEDVDNRSTLRWASKAWDKVLGPLGTPFNGTTPGVPRVATRLLTPFRGQAEMSLIPGSPEETAGSLHLTLWDCDGEVTNDYDISLALLKHRFQEKQKKEAS